jgi:hypothetical protein
MSKRDYVVIELPEGRRTETPETVKKTPHCYRAGSSIPQGVQHVGGVGSKVVYGLMDDDSECAFCFCVNGDHSRSCPRSGRSVRD